MLPQSPSFSPGCARLWALVACLALVPFVALLGFAAPQADDFC